MRKVFLSLGVASVLMSSTAMAGEHSPKYNYEITPVVSGVLPEGNLGLKGQLAYGLRFGQFLNNSYFDEWELGIDYTKAKYKNKYNVEDFDEEKTNIFRGSINFLKYLPLGKYFSFYGLVGLGGERISDHLYDNHDRMFANYGVGMKYFITEALALRTELRHVIKLNASEDHWSQNELFYTLGLSYAFGKVAPKAPVAAAPVMEEKVVAPMVEEKVTILDDDKDGVANSIDECPDTPMGVPVGDNGCAKTISLNVNFGFNQSTIMPKYDAQIDKVADFMKTYPVYKVMLEGYTDSVGNDAYNLKLSDKRSQAVAKALEDKGVQKDRISTVGYGEDKPVASNETKEGRAQNRRVDAVFSY